MIHSVNTTKHLSAILGKWKGNDLYLKTLLLMNGREFYVKEGTADALYCSLGYQQTHDYVVREDMDSRFNNFITYYRHCKHNLKYKKLFYFSSGTGQLKEVSEFYREKLEYLYLCMLSGAKDFHYVEPGWFNNR